MVTTSFLTIMISIKSFHSFTMLTYGFFVLIKEKIFQENNHDYEKERNDSSRTLRYRTSISFYPDNDNCPYGTCYCYTLLALALILWICSSIPTFTLHKKIKLMSIFFIKLVIFISIIIIFPWIAYLISLLFKKKRTN